MVARCAGVVATALLIVAGAGATATARETHPAATGCRHVAGAAPALYVDAGLAGYVTAFGAVPCRFSATASGGVASAGAFVLTVERDGRVLVHRGAAGDCADGLIRAGDRVTLDATVLAAAGAASGC
jgi:hypothetical protein